MLNAALMGVMVPPALPGGIFGPAVLPVGLAGPGIYIIVNQNTNNRYVGISTNLAIRFNPRMEVVTELGFSIPDMNNIEVYWGTVTTQNTPGFGGALLPPIIPVGAYGAPLNVPIDGVGVQLERLLIRFVLTQLGAGGTVSNNMLAFAPYINPTGNPVTVNFAWGGGVLFLPGAAASIWPVGGAW
ncbi:MAG: hypothetical protein HGA19_03005 [Oscillochloris sp.]|nr:hypothetical protein [Oscillochloris sp.]